MYKFIVSCQVNNADAILTRSLEHRHINRYRTIYYLRLGSPSSRPQGKDLTVNSLFRVVLGSTSKEVRYRRQGSIRCTNEHITAAKHWILEDYAEHALELSHLRGEEVGIFPDNF